MSKRSKNRRNRKSRKPKPPLNTTVNLGPTPVVDREATLASMMIDAAGDREWLRQHPHAEYRERPASERELKATGLPAGARVLVMRGPMGSQFRVFVDQAELTG